MPKLPKTLYTPQPILNRSFKFSDKTTALMADAEISFTRIDERSVRYPYGSALRKAIARLESIATICIDGVSPDLDTMYKMWGSDYPFDDRQINNSPLNSLKDPSIREATLDALRYEHLINRISIRPKEAPLTEHEFIGVHTYLRHGSLDGSQSHYRNKHYHIPTSSPEKGRTVYIPPKPEMIKPLMVDLFEFANTRRLSPVTQAAIAHFQLEAIKPFKTAMDRTGRALSHAIMRRRGFYEHLIPPIALIPAMDIEHHACLLLPYRTGRNFTNKTVGQILDNWVAHCARCISLSSKLTEIYMNSISDIVDSWKSTIGEYRHGSALDILIRELPGIPVVSIASAMSLTGKGFSAVNDAVGHLVDKGILTSDSSIQRNRYFEATEVVNMERRILQQTIPPDIMARESFCE